MKMTKEQITTFLLEDWGYVPAQVSDVVEKMFKMDGDIQTAFDYWQETGEFPEAPEFSGYTPNSISRFKALKPPAVFLMLDTERREPAQAN